MDRSSAAVDTPSMRFAAWLATPLGDYLKEREQAYFDETVADIFGFHALQIGLPECAYLGQSRIASRWSLDYDPPADIIADPHGLLREAWRVIRPEGQIVISGFNPFSLFGTRRYFGRGSTPPWNGNFIALYRLKDWLTLLGFDVVGGRFDCYVPPFTQEKWLRRFAFFESTGDRWWPITGGVYYLRATKKVLGMRVLAPAWERRERRTRALAPAARAREGLTTHTTAPLER
jgi:SAM-dependent methyltransferase